jgi:crotonobetainyl-CoA:carnitine CoA-transferase CaiB-like acyl-CoA transferase
LLKDILVLDLTDEQGSFCSKLLADLGATVIKVEGPEGDPARRRNPNSFFYGNTNKLGFGIDLKTGEGDRAFRNLVIRADVLVETFTPGDPEFLDRGPQRLHRINPRLIHISITPFGRTGPPGALPSRQATQRCMVFAPGLHGRECPSGAQKAVASERNPRSLRRGIRELCGRVPDTGAPGNNLELFGCLPCYTASLFGAVAALIRLKKRKITGSGSYFDLSIHEAVASMLECEMVDYLHGREDK